MKLALCGVLLLSLSTWASPSAGAADRETVHLLVPVDVPTDRLGPSSVESSTSGWTRVTVPVVGTVEATAAAVGRQLGAETYVERSYPLLGGEEEPLFDQQWGLENTGQSGGTVDADIDIARAWSQSTGEGVVVAVVDSGVDTDHPELITQMWVNPDETLNGVDDDGNGFVDDLEGWDFEGSGSGDNDPRPDGSSMDDAHATLIAGVIAAAVDGQGVSGVAPDASIMNVKACGQGSCLTLDAIEGIHYAVDNGADIINLSFGGPVPEAFGDPPLSAAIEYARQRDVLVVTAAGNTPPDLLGPDTIIAPAELPHSNNLSVTASDRRDRLASFSFYSDNIDLAAPGVDILTTSLSGLAFVSGTSFSAPMAAGAAALLLARDPGISHLELSARLMAWSDTPATIGGRVGAGRLNAGNVVTMRFVDTVGNTFRSDIDWAAETGVTQGCNPPANTEFCPDDSVTRGQMAAFIRRHLGLAAATKDYFEDDTGSTFEADINAIAQAGITRGCNPPANDRFCPEDDVSREQMAAFIVRALDLREDTHSGFDDVTADNTFISDIGRLATAGITRGCNPPSNSLFCPKDDVTRGQMTAFLHRSAGG